MQNTAILFLRKRDPEQEQGADLTLYHSAVRIRMAKQEAARAMELQQQAIQKAQREKRLARRRERAYAVAITALIALLSAGTGAAAALAWALAR